MSQSFRFLIAGILRFGGRHALVMPLAHTTLAITLWTAFTVFQIDDFLLRTIPRYAVSGGALIVAGIVMLRRYGPDPAAASRLVGVVLLAWGLHKLNYPWLRPVEWFEPLAFLLADFLAQLAARGLLQDA